MKDEHNHSNACWNKISLSILFSVHFVDSRIVFCLVCKEAVQKEVAGNVDSIAKKNDEMVQWHHLFQWKNEFMPWIETGLVQHHRRLLECRISDLLIVKGSPVEERDTFTNNYGLDNKAIALQDVLNNSHHAASNIQVTNQSGTAAVDNTTNTNSVYGCQHCIAVLNKYFCIILKNLDTTIEYYT